MTEGFTHRFVLSNLQRTPLAHMEITEDRKVRFVMTNAISLNRNYGRRGASWNIMPPLTPPIYYSVFIGDS